jgi:uncharacterized protein
MASDNIELVRGAYEAFGRGDIDGVMSILTDDVEWRSPRPLPQAIDANGKAEVGEFFQRVGANWDDFGLDIADFVASGNRVCVIGRAAGVHNGERTGYGFVHSWTVNGGACDHFDEYVDPQPELLAG